MSRFSCGEKRTGEHAPPRQVQWGNRVCVDFLAWLEDGTLVDSSIYKKPVIFTAGASMAKPYVERIVVGMRIGESRTERIPADEAFEAYNLELTCRISRTWMEECNIVPTVKKGHS